MKGSYNYHGEVHLEIVDQEQLTLGKHQDEHPNELGDCDTTQNLPKNKCISFSTKSSKLTELPMWPRADRALSTRTRLPFTRYEPAYNVG